MAEVSLTEQPHFQQIDLQQLSLPQLTQLKQQLEQEILIFRDSLKSLKIAQNKFQESNDSLDKFTPEAKGKEILVPLTGSMYVTGKLANTEKVLIDIGTGYYAEERIPEAKEYFSRRTKFVAEQVKKIEEMYVEKTNIRNAIISVMTMKLEEAQGKAQKKE